MKTLCLCIGLLVCAVANADDWTLVATSTAGATYQFRNGSFMVAPDKGAGVQIGAVEQVTDLQHNIAVHYVVTEVSFCRQGFGTLVTFRLNSDTAIETDDVVHGGSSIASEEFDTLCALYASDINKSST